MGSVPKSPLGLRGLAQCRHTAGWEQLFLKTGVEYGFLLLVDRTKNALQESGVHGASTPANPFDC